MISSPPRFSPARRRALDRRSFWAHAFHRYAHHPLCDRYRGERIRLRALGLPSGRTELCRGCTFAILGGSLGLMVGMATRVLVGPEVALACLPPLALVALLPRRWPKLVKRCLPAALGCWALVGGTWLVAAEAAAIALVALALYRRRGPNRGPCRTCPERTFEVCRGFAPILRRERALQRHSRQLRVVDPAV